MNYETIHNYNRYAAVVGKNRERHTVTHELEAVTEQTELADIQSQLSNHLDPEEPNQCTATPVYAAWRDLIGASGPYSHLFTLAFKHTYPDSEAISALVGWANMMNRKLRGPRWKIKEAGLTGVAFAERHALSFDFRGRLHFHVLLSAAASLPATSELSAIAYSCALALKDGHGRQMTDSARIDLKEVTQEDRLLGYLLKDLFTADWEAGESIAFWTRDSGMNAFPLRSLSSRQLKLMH